MANGLGRTYLVPLKVKVALAELAQQFDNHPNQITNWKGQVSEGTGTVLIERRQASFRAT